MYYAKKFNLKTGEISIEGVHDTAEGANDICVKLVQEEEKQPTSTCVFVVETTEEHQRTIDDAIWDTVSQIAKEEGIPAEHVPEIAAIFKQKIQS